MIELGDIFEITTRGAAAGISFLLGIVLGLRGPVSLARGFAALFSFSVGVYILIGGAATKLLYGPFIIPAAIISILGTVFFWWFAAALFDDEFRWRWWRLAPFFALPGIYIIRKMLGDSPITTALLYLHLTTNAALFADAFRLAISHVGDDLIDPRRRFRVAIAAIIGIFGIGIAAAEIIEETIPISEAVMRFHAAAIFLLNLIFGAWLVAPRGVLFVGSAAAPVLERDGWPETPQGLRAADRQAYEKLMALMDAGAYREEGLSVAKLAEKVGVPEHHLRKLINGALGFRNFAAFLNDRRIADAKAELSNPDNARKQILQIALDLGYGSIAPFNRAFKSATGATPSEFRKQAIGDG